MDNLLVPTTRVVNVKYSPYDIYIGRIAAYNHHFNLCQLCQKKYLDQNGWCGEGLRLLFLGNPYVIGADGNRNQVIDKYKVYLWRRIKKFHSFRLQVRSIRGQVLGCWCKAEFPEEQGDIRCHGDVLAEATEMLNAGKTLVWSSSPEADTGSTTISSSGYSVNGTKYRLSD